MGAGTILTPAQLDAVRNSGAAFGISPGITPTLAKAAEESGLTYFPGVGGASDLMLAEHGLTWSNFSLAISSAASKWRKHSVFSLM